MPEGSISLNTVQLYGAPISAEYDYTDPSVALEYYNQISILNAILARDASTSPMTAADAANVNTALAALQTLAQNGLMANSTVNIYPPVVTMKKYFLTTQMATNLDLLYRSFAATGATGSPPTSLTLEQLSQWKDLSVVSPVIQNILAQATYSATSNRSLQSLIELEYVKTGSDLIGEQLSSLNDALTTTNNVLNTLANLQDLRNRMVVKTPTGYVTPTSAMIDPNSDGKSGIHSGDIMSAYRGAASAYFNQNIVPQVSPSLFSGVGLSSAGDTVYASLLAIQKSLLAFIPQLSGIMGASGLADSNSIYNRIKKISGDFSAMFQDGGTPAADITVAISKSVALRVFFLDNNLSTFNVPGRSPGDSQANLNFGITAGQAFNDVQKENVKRFINIFEEYYKSASAVLQAITQIIQKMAQNISR